MWIVIHLLGGGSAIWAFLSDSLDSAKHAVLYTLAIIYFSAMTFFYVAKGFFWIYREILSIRDERKGKEKQ